ncbi:MAG TPA: hypothetical protein VF281_02435 [Candidatus Saccharimonadales bacterium]
MNPENSKIVPQNKSRIVLWKITKILWLVALLIWPLFILLNKTIDSADQWTIRMFGSTIEGAFKMGLFGFIDLTTLATFISGLVLALTYRGNILIKIAIIIATAIVTVFVFAAVQLFGIFLLYQPLSQI